MLDAGSRKSASGLPTLGRGHRGLGHRGEASASALRAAGRAPTGPTPGGPRRTVDGGWPRGVARHPGRRSPSCAPTRSDTGGVRCAGLDHRRGQGPVGRIPLIRVQVPLGHHHVGPLHQQAAPAGGTFPVSDTAGTVPPPDPRATNPAPVPRVDTAADLLAAATAHLAASRTDKGMPNAAPPTRADRSRAVDAPGSPPVARPDGLRRVPTPSAAPPDTPSGPAATATSTAAAAIGKLRGRRSASGQRPSGLADGMRSCPRVKRWWPNRPPPARPVAARPPTRPRTGLAPVGYADRW